MKTYQSKTRRGVLLLVILALLAMFALVAVAFVVLTGRALTGAKQIQQIDQHLDQPDQDLERAAMQILRGTNNPASVIGPHSLLEDVYGNGWAYGLMRDNSIPATDPTMQTVCGGQLVEFTASITNPARYVGNVLTMLDGPAVGQSTRIVGYNSSNNRFQIVAFQDTTTTNLITYCNTVAATDNPNYAINGTPFSGTGFGYNSTLGNLEAWDPDGPHPGPPDPWPYALLPNPTAFQPNAGLSYTDPAGPGGANEDYDAVDFQNMLLGAQIPLTGGAVATIPSLHRSALVNYWATTGDPTTWYDTDPLVRVPLHRKVILRPLAEDHFDDTDGDGIFDFNDINGNNVFDPGELPAEPHFTGSNPFFDPAWDGVPAAGVTAQWDVDNDGDGVADSVWVDLGMPARSTPDGRLYKPLFAILCLDMDGRLNLNAHGCLAQTDNTYGNPVQPTTEIPIPNPNATFAGSPIPQPTLPRGQGYGPADVNLRPLFQGLADPDVAYSAIFTGDGTWDGRYGGPQQPGLAGNDPLSYNQHFDYPNNYPSAPFSYGSPPDMKAQMAVGLDLRGQPLYAMLGGIWTNAGSDDPYELNLSQNTSRGLSSPSAAPDNPFSVAELERLLRPFDRDATRLPDRLAQLTYLYDDPDDTPDEGFQPYPVFPTPYTNRHNITTESWSLPCPSVALPPELRAFGLPKHVTDLLAAKGVTANWDDLFPPELLAGLRMDINRPFGNGRDGDGIDNDNDDLVDETDETTGCNGVVDEPTEAFNGENFTQFDQNGDPITPVFCDPSNGSDVDGDGMPGAAIDRKLARQLHARHLYVMMLLLMNYTPDADDARQVAQWAVNIVDFRDRDSIMTPFEYDIKPFTDDDASAPTPIPGTWDVDGDLATDEHNTTPAVERGVVWGCERPELLITETLAFHDRRTEDLATDPTLKKTTDDPTGTPPDNDDDFDQVWKPEGSLFIELYNPWTTLEPQSGELYETTHGGVDLTRHDGNSPTWRLLIVDGKDLRDPDDPAGTTKWPTFERSVYFVDSTVTLPTDDNSKVKFRPEDAQVLKIAPILPGRYMVIGPGEPGDTVTSTTYIGFADGKDPGTPGSSRRIELKPDNDPDTTGQVAVVSVGGTTAGNNDLTDVTIQNTVAVVVNSPRRLSISELDGGYAGLYTSDPTSALDPPTDQGTDPANPSNPLWNGADVKLKNNGRFNEVKIVHLQRLANPLIAHHLDTNPYRTIDSMPIDLTSFNGVTIAVDNGPNTVVAETGDDSAMLLTRERGEHNDTANPNNLWTQEPYGNSPKDNVNNIPVDPTATHYFDEKLHHTLGYLNDDFGLPRGTAGYVGDPPQQTTGPPPETKGPFPWLTWNNRPFVSQLELMLVPKWRSSQLLQEYGLDAGGAAPYTNYHEPFPHMISFFYDSHLPGDTPNWKLYRLLDYLHVPSRFVGTELQANPANCVGGTHSFHPPFNRISNYRDPGKINLNTIFSETVFDGLMNDFPGVDWQRFRRSRRGYGVDGDDITSVDNAWPTRFVRPFRSAAAADLVPLDDMKPQTLPKQTPPDLREIRATLLRSDAVLPTDTSSIPLFDFTSTNDYDDTDRNPFFRYQGIQRLGNLVTTRSNVYAVWITVGYFEVAPAPNDPVTGVSDPAIYPDGYALGAELGSDTGEINRHRAFYMFDRSIPVAFQRGKDLNVEKAVLLRRFIE